TRRHPVLISAANDEGIEAAHFRLEQTGRGRQQIGTERVAAHQLAEIAAGVRFGHALWPHLEELDRDTAASKLPGDSRTSEHATDKTHDVFHGFLHRQKTIRAGREKIGARGVDPDDWTKRSA